MFLKTFPFQNMMKDIFRPSLILLDVSFCIDTERARPGITQSPVAPCAGCLIQTNKAKIQIQSSAEWIITSLSPAHQRKKTKQNKTQHISHPIRNLHKPLEQHYEGRNQKEERSNLEAQEKETSNTISFKKNYEKAEKYCTNEGTS